MKCFYQKCFLFTLIIVSFNTLSFAQIFDKSRGKNLQKLIAEPVTVYTSSPGAYTDRLKAAFKDYWKVTPYNFVNIDNASKEVKGSPVFMPIVVSLIIRGNNSGISYPFYVYGEANGSGNVDGEAIVAAFPINSYLYEFDAKADNIYAGSILRLPYIVYNLNDMVNWLKTNGNEKGYEKYIEDKSPRLAGKILLVPAELTKEWDINPNSTALFKGNLAAAKKSMRAQMITFLEESSISFGGKYKVMPTAEIMKLEQSADANKYALFLPALDQKRYMIAYDLKTKELLYFEYANMGFKIKDKDFDKMNKAAGF